MNQRTILYQEHFNLDARMVPFGGWEMPVQYAGILQEHRHTRTSVSLFDICHMGEFEVGGPDAAADLERLLTMSVSTLTIGQCRYGFMLNEKGGVIDDLTCYRLGEERYYLVVNAATRQKDSDWIRNRLSAGTQFEDVSDKTAKLDLQGPASRAALERVVGRPVPELGYFRIVPFDFGDGIEGFLSRTGYTGEFGYELYFPAGNAVALWNRLLADPEIEPAGLGARDTLRLEMGYSLYGHELSEDRSPVATSRGMFIRKQGEFIGCEMVRAELENGCSRYLVPLRLETKRAAREGDLVFHGDREIGVVSSGSLAPSLGCAVALAFVDAGCSAEGTQLSAEVRGKRLDAVVTKLPFYTEGTARR